MLPPGHPSGLPFSEGDVVFTIKDAIGGQIKFDVYPPIPTINPMFKSFGGNSYHVVAHNVALDLMKCISDNAYRKIVADDIGFRFPNIGHVDFFKKTGQSIFTVIVLKDWEGDYAICVDHSGDDVQFTLARSYTMLLVGLLAKALSFIGAVNVISRRNSDLVYRHSL